MIQIGAPLPSTEPLALLTDCHRRIEAALAILVSAAQWPEVLDEERREALARALRFFEEMAPKHTADEEKSLFPRLRAIGETLPELEALEADHETADHWHDELNQLCHAWLAQGILDTGARQVFAERVGQLEGLYRNHIEIEESVVFPLARLRLPLATQEDVRREMVGRRAITLLEAPPLN